MSRIEATVEELLGFLPDVEDLELLRLRIIGAAVPDPGKAWDSSSAYSTVDKRIVSAEQVDQAVRDAEEILRAHVTSLYAGLRPVFAAFYAGHEDDAARRLIDLGEQLEDGGRLKGSRQCYRSALSLTLPLLDKSTQILALRRIARVSLTLGDFQEAAAHYERSAQLARDAGDMRGEVVARTGTGNVLVWQGRWTDAEACYHEALALLESAEGKRVSVERAQLCNNLGNMATRLGRFPDAEAWLAQGLEMWSTLSSPLDLAICYMVYGLLRERQGRWAEAREQYERARALPVPPGLLSGIATDMAELCVQEGHLSQAQEWGRVAEEHAIRSGSAYMLGRMYQGRGNIARAAGDEDGFTFFEKALEIAREKGYPFLEAEALANYAGLRMQTGGAEEAEAYLERAREIFRELGAVRDLARVEEALAEFAPKPPPFEAEPEEQEPLATAGD